MIKDFEKKAKAYALKNALAHEGKAMQGAVISALFNEGLKKEDIGKYAKKISEIIMEVNSLSQAEKEKEFEKLKEIVSERETREGLPELPDVKKSGVIMRFAPSASGPFHIGHAIIACISSLYVKKYGGKFYVRIEDTNPENIYPQAYKLIEQESSWLFDNKAEIIIQSDRMNLYYKYAEKLIEKKSAYVCTCPSEEFKKFAEEKKNCPCRKLSVEENLKKWKKMLGTEKENYQEGDAVLRFRTPKEGMKHKNPAMRDFPLARINLTEHARQKNKYRVWPLMNLAVAVDDVEMKMTHIIRGKDHMDNAKRQEMIYDVLGKKYPWTAFIGRYKFKDMELSTTKMREAIEKKEYSGWDDPLLPTIASLKKQGYKPHAFWKFAEQVGLSEVDKVMDKKEYFNLLKLYNKKEN
jgi:glutamyl-tRNA synthetase